MLRTSYLAGVALAIGTACVGQIGDSGSGAPDVTGDDLPPSENLATNCAADAAPGASWQSFRRLTSEEIAATLEVLVGADAFATVAAYAALLPDDRAVGAPELLSITFTADHAAAIVKLIAALAENVAASETYRTRLVGACANTTNKITTDCVASFVRRFGARAFRRPVTDDDVELYVGAYNATADTADKVPLLVMRLLAAPDVLFHNEPGTGENVQGRIRLTQHEVASRIAFQMTGSMPDAELSAAADAGELADVAAVRAQVFRLLQSERGRRHLADFARYWLKLDDTPTPDAVATDRLALDADALRETALSEASELIAYVAFERGGTLDDLFTSADVVTKDKGLAKLYGTTAWTGNGGPPQAEHHRGLLTRVAYLLSPVDATSPIMRSVQSGRFRVRGLRSARRVPYGRSRLRGRRDRRAARHRYPSRRFEDRHLTDRCVERRRADRGRNVGGGGERLRCASPVRAPRAARAASTDIPLRYLHGIHYNGAYNPDFYPSDDAMTKVADGVYARALKSVSGTISKGAALYRDDGRAANLGEWFNRYRDKLTVIRGLDLQLNEATPGLAHSRYQTSAATHHQAGGYYRWSVDMVLENSAKFYKVKPSVPGLRLGYQIVRSSIWNGKDQPYIIKPRGAFERVFGVCGSTTTPTTADAVNRRRLLLVDSVYDDYKRHRDSAFISAEGKHQLEDWMALVADLEKTLDAKVGTTTLVSCDTVPKEKVSHGEWLELNAKIAVAALASNNTCVATLIMDGSADKSLNVSHQKIHEHNNNWRRQKDWLYNGCVRVTAHW